MLAGCTSDGGDNVSFNIDTQAADPVVLEIPIAYIRRRLPETPPDLSDPLAFNPGAQLLVRERSAASATEIDITPDIAAIVAEELGVSSEQLAIDIKGIESSYDGKTLIFAARVVPEPVDNNLEFTTWNLWLLDLASMQPSYLIPSRLKRNEGVETGGGHDIDPYFLGDDRIVFSSTRQVASQAKLLNEGRPQIFSALDEDRRDPAAVLHIYDPLQRDREFRQISFNLSHDLDPLVLRNGDIVFSRWNNTRTDHISLYRISPAGEGLSPLYGFNSQRTGTNGSPIEFSQARELDGGWLVSVIKPFASTTFGGDIAVIDADSYADFDQPTWDNQGMGGQGHQSLTDTEVRTDGLLSSGGQFGSVYPLHDGTGRALVSWSQCRVIDEDGAFIPCTLQPDNSNAAPPLYGAWVYDPIENTQQPVVLPAAGFMISEVIAAEPRDFPDLMPRADNYNAALALENKGLLLIDSVYDLDGEDDSPQGIARHATPGTTAFRERPARFLRIVLPVPIPDDDVFDIPRYAAGVAGNGNFREIAGYVPIEPDGSVTAAVIANQAFIFSVLDENGRRIGRRHNHWLQLAPGEVLHCSGCHNANSGLSHGRLDSQPVSANPGAIDLATGGSGFPGTDTIAMFATQAGQTMAQTWDFHRPHDEQTEPGRRLLSTQRYLDQWTDLALTPDPAITDRAYDPGWTDIPPGRGIVVDNLDPTLPSRIVINYIDHIQVIWQRVRAPVVGADAIAVDNCLGCHSTLSDTVVPAGQLDLSALSSDIDPDHMRSYRELLSRDQEQWIDAAGNISDRQRLCTEIDEDGNVLTLTETLALNPPMRGGSANGSGNFFACFEGGSCGLSDSLPLPDNCTEDGGTVIVATRNTINHSGMLTASELRLISEWLDIGAQYYNNPFDARLQ